MSAFMDSGHRWWMQCPACDMAWFIGERPEHGRDAEEECRRCMAGGDAGLRAEGYAQAREQAASMFDAATQTARDAAEGYPRGTSVRERLLAQSLTLEEGAKRIRAMQDDSGDRRCGACGVPEVEGRYECRCTGMAAPPPAHRCGGCPHRIHAPNECLGDGGDCDCGWVP